MRSSSHNRTCQDVFRRITSLSYMGDVRMGLAEDSKKVERIVSGSYDGFKQLYLPVLQVSGTRHDWSAGQAVPVTQPDALHAGATV